MKKHFMSFQKIFAAAGGAFLVIVFLSACNKNSGPVQDIPAAGLLAFNLSPDQEAVGISLSGNRLTNQPLGYTSFTGNYQNVYVGSRDIESYGYFNDSVLNRSTVNFENQKYYSLFVVGNNGVYRNITVNDDIDSSATADKAYIRFINAIPDSSAPKVTVVAGGVNVIDQQAPFATVSTFTPVAGGDITIGVANGGAIAASRNIAVEKGKVYTALLIGVPGATDSAKAVQIRYIVNGTIPAPTSK